MSKYGLLYSISGKKRDDSANGADWCSLWTTEKCAKGLENMFTLIVLKILIFFLHNSQKCCTFALEIQTKTKFSDLSPLNQKTYYENEILHNETANAGFSPAFVRWVCEFYSSLVWLLYMRACRYARAFVSIRYYSNVFRSTSLLTIA